MSRAWFAACVGGGVMIALGAVYAQVTAVQPERLIAERFGFTPQEVARASSGQAVAKLLPSRDAADVGVFGALRINRPADRLVVWLNDIAAFRTAAQLGTSRRLSNPPQLDDFAGLSLDATTLAALRQCRPGKCDLQIGDTAIQRFQSEVNWTAPDAADRANRLAREMLLGHAQAYLQGGDQALGAYQNEKAPRVLAEEFQQVLQQSKALYDVAPALAAYLERFPASPLEGAESFLYWASGGVGPEASISVHQLIVYRAPGGDVMVADKQLFASRYVDAAITLVSLVPAPDGQSFYALVGARARSRMLQGVGARILRGTVERATIDTTRMYLDWVRASLSL